VSQTEDNCTTPELLTPVGSVEYMAPEVVDAWVGESFSYHILIAIKSYFHICIICFSCNFES
jgi:hypothetical protein